MSGRRHGGTADGRRRQPARAGSRAGYRRRGSPDNARRDGLADEPDSRVVLSSGESGHRCRVARPPQVHRRWLEDILDSGREGPRRAGGSGVWTVGAAVHSGRCRRRRRWRGHQSARRPCVGVHGPLAGAQTAGVDLRQRKVRRYARCRDHAQAISGRDPGGPDQDR